MSTINAVAAAVLSASSGAFSASPAEQNISAAAALVVSLRNQASMLHKQGNFEGAIARYTDALQLFESIPRAASATAVVVANKKSAGASAAVAATAAASTQDNITNLPADVQEKVKELLADRKKSRSALLALRSLSNLKRGDSLQALRDAQESTELDPHTNETGHVRLVEAHLMLKNFKAASDISRARIIALEQCGRRLEAEKAELETFLDDCNNDDDDDDNGDNNEKEEKDPSTSSSKSALAMCKTKPALSPEQQKRLHELTAELNQTERCIETFNGVLESCYDAMTRSGELQKPTSIKVSDLRSKAMKQQAEWMGQKVETQQRQKVEKPDDYCTHGGPAPTAEIKKHIADWYRSGSGTLVTRAFAAFQNNPDPAFWNDISRSCISLAVSAVIFEDYNDVLKFVKSAMLCRLLLKDGVATVTGYLDEDFVVKEDKEKALFDKLAQLRESNRYLVDFVKNSVPCKCLAEY